MVYANVAIAWKQVFIKLAVKDALREYHLSLNDVVSHDIANERYAHERRFAAFEHEYWREELILAYSKIVRKNVELRDLIIFVEFMEPENIEAVAIAHAEEHYLASYIVTDAHARANVLDMIACVIDENLGLVGIL